MARRAVPTFDELYAAIAALPEGVTGEILEPGELRTMARPGKGHRRAVQGLFRALGAMDASSSGVGWWIEIEPEVRFGARLAVPDLAGWRVERVADMPEDDPITIVPDWCCETLSKSTARDDRRLKLPLYAAEGVGHVWLVDPELRLVEVYVTTKDGLPALLGAWAEQDETPIPPFDLPVSLSGLWGDADAR